MADNKLERVVREAVRSRQQTERGVAPPPAGASVPVPGRSLSPPPAPLLPSVAEQRELAKVKAEKQDLEQRLAQIEQRFANDEGPSVSVDVQKRTFSLRLGSLAGLAGLLAALGLGGAAMSRTAPETVKAHGEILQDEKKKSEELGDRTGEIVAYEKKLAEAYDCRFRQLASASERANGYRLGFTSDNVEWQSVCLTAGAKVCQGPLWQAHPCPEVPSPPK